MESNLVCVRVKELSVCPVEGSWIERCRDCSVPVWVSGSGLRAAGGEAVKIVCLQCARKDPEFLESLQPPTPEQLDEIRRWMVKYVGPR